MEAIFDESAASNALHVLVGTRRSFADLAWIAFATCVVAALAAFIANHLRNRWNTKYALRGGTRASQFLRPGVVPHISSGKACRSVVEIGRHAAHLAAAVDPARGESSSWPSRQSSSDSSGSLQSAPAALRPAGGKPKKSASVIWADEVEYLATGLVRSSGSSLSSGDLSGGSVALHRTISTLPPRPVNAKPQAPPMSSIAAARAELQRAQQAEWAATHQEASVGGQDSMPHPVFMYMPLPAATTGDDAAGADAEALHTQTDERRTSRSKNRTSSAGRMARRHQKATSKDQADTSSGGKKHTSPAVGAKPAPNLAAYMASPQRASRSAGPRDLAENASFAVPDGLPRPSIPPLRLSAITPLAATPVAFGGMSAMTTPTSSAASTPRMFEPLVPAPSMTATRRQRQDSDSSIISTSIDTRPSQRNKTEAPAAREAGKAPRQGSWVDEDPESFAYIYDEPWARSLGVKAPPRRSHRREGLNAAAAASDSRGDVAAKSADTPRPTAGFGIFSGLGARGHAAPTAAPTRSLSGLDFSQLERPLPPIDTLKRSPSPPKPAPQQPLPAVPAPQPSRRSAATPAIPVAAAREAPPQIPTPHAAVPPIRVVPARASTFNLPTTTQLPSQGVSPFAAGGAPPTSSAATKPTMPSARLSPIIPSLKPPGDEAAPVAPPPLLPANVEPAVASVPTPSETAKPNERSIPPPAVQQPQAAAPAAWGGSGGAAPGLSTGVRQAQQSAAPPTTGAWGAKSTSAIGAGAFGGSAASALGGAAVTATPAATFGGRPPLAPAPPPPSKVRYDDEVLPPEAYAAAMSHMPPAMKSMLFANVAPSRPTLGGSAAVASLTAPAPPQRGAFRCVWAATHTAASAGCRLHYSSASARWLRAACRRGPQTGAAAERAEVRWGVRHGAHRLGQPTADRQRVRAARGDAAATTSRTGWWLRPRRHRRTGAWRLCDAGCPGADVDARSKREREQRRAVHHVRRQGCREPVGRCAATERLADRWLRP
jgi:hypothetical protein